MKGYVMNVESQPASQEIGSSISLFLRGFFIRLLYGSLGIPILFIFRPEFFSENTFPLVYGLCIYSAVCIAGGIYDVSTRQKRRIKLWEKPRMIDVIAIALIISGLINLK
jgi:hypothetical protein